jgi:hypothetical protein
MNMLWKRVCLSMVSMAAIIGLCPAGSLSLQLWAQKSPADQWPNYQNNSNFSPLTFRSSPAPSGAWA